MALIFTTDMGFLSWWVELAPGAPVLQNGQRVTTGRPGRFLRHQGTGSLAGRDPGRAKASALGSFHRRQGRPDETLHLVVLPKIQDGTVELGGKIMADADFQLRFHDPGSFVIAPSGPHFTQEWFSGQCPGEVQALLPAPARAQVAVQRPAEHPDHFQGRIGEEEPAMARDIDDSKDSPGALITCGMPGRVIRRSCPRPPAATGHGLAVLPRDVVNAG